jgi:hypothetical protein
MASLALLGSRDIWNERNDRVFWNKASTTMMVVNKIKEQVELLEHRRSKSFE